MHKHKQSGRERGRKGLEGERKGRGREEEGRKIEMNGGREQVSKGETKGDKRKRVRQLAGQEERNTERKTSGEREMDRGKVKENRGFKKL